MFSAMQINGLIAIVALWKGVLKVQSTLSPDFKYFMNIESNVKNNYNIFGSELSSNSRRYHAKIYSQRDARSRPKLVV